MSYNFSLDIYMVPTALPHDPLVCTVDNYNILIFEYKEAMSILFPENTGQPKIGTIKPQFFH